MVTDRQRRILWAVVDTYITEAEPVGSRVIAERPDVGVSAATIRNEMANLEAMGFLQQPHTSAGRVPAQKGYRFYVDHLLTPQQWTKGDALRLWEECFEEVGPIERVFQQATGALAGLTQCITVLVVPDYEGSHLVHLQLVPLSERLVLSLWVTDRDHVHRSRVTLPCAVSAEVLERLTHFLNERLRGTSVVQLHHVSVALAVEFSAQEEQHEGIQELVDQLFPSESTQEQGLYSSGTKQMLAQPEFHSVDRMRALLDFMESGVSQLMAVAPRQGVQVRIGYENQIAEFQDLSVVTVSYQMDEKPVGTLGIIGPMRMDYGRMIGLADFWAAGVSSWLQRRYS